MDYSGFNELIYFVITTEKDKMNAYKISNLLLEEALVPCVTFKNIESHFWWEGEINKSKEVQLIIKCNEANIKKIYDKVYEYHSYDVPEIIYFPVSANNDYFQWVNSF